MRTIFLCTCLFISFHLSVIAQKPAIIPFELTKYNNMSVQAVLNGKDTVRLMFHTAAGSLTLIEESVKKLSSLQFSGADTVKSWGGSDNTARFSKSNTLQIGTLTWEQQPIWENKYSGPETDGKFGHDLFKDKVIEIDFDKKRILVHTSLPAKTKRYTKLKATFNNDMMFIEGTCNTGSQSISNRFLIHSGYSGCIMLDDKFVADNKLGGQLKVIDTKELKDSYGNVLKTRNAILPNFVIGNTTFTNVPVSFFEGAIGRQKMSVIGGNILKRFNIIIDAPRTFVYLRPNKAKKTPYTG